MWHVRRNKECLPSLYNVINDRIAFADTNFDVAFQLVKIFFRINQVEIVARVGAFDNHDEEIAAIIQILVAHRWLEVLAVFFNPALLIDLRLHSLGHTTGTWRSRTRFGSEFSHG